MKPVLIVDDEQQIRSLVKTLLAGEGFESIEASDGCSAFLTTQKLAGGISLLVTDINMPGSPVNGVELPGAVKSEFPEFRFCLFRQSRVPPRTWTALFPAMCS